MMANDVAQKPPKRPKLLLDGVILLDKPEGWSSNDALIKVKRLLRAAKAGHTGTLDPFATGLLPLCFGEATKFSHDLLEADKTYQTEVVLGIRTSTGDTEGEVIGEKTVDVSLVQIEAVLAQFRGKISQVPPMHSALKRDGKPLYEYARQGITLERQAREVEILELQLLEYQAPILRLQVKCSKGTYIRVLGEDIGEALGCGAHLRSLRRTQVAQLELANAIRLDTLLSFDEEQRPTLLAPVDSLLSNFPALVLDEAAAQRLLHGQRLNLAKLGVVAPCESGRVRIYNQQQRLLGTGWISAAEHLAPERLIVRP